MTYEKKHFFFKWFNAAIRWTRISKYVPQYKQYKCTSEHSAQQWNLMIWLLVIWNLSPFFLYLLSYFLCCNARNTEFKSDSANTYVYKMRAHFLQWLNQTNTNKWISIIVWYSLFLSIHKISSFYILTWYLLSLLKRKHFCIDKQALFIFIIHTKKIMPNSLARTCIAVFKFIAFHFYMFSFLLLFFLPILALPIS